jgi:hypothetical protein
MHFLFLTERIVSSFFVLQLSRQSNKLSKDPLKQNCADAILLRCKYIAVVVLLLSTDRLKVTLKQTHKHSLKQRPGRAGGAHRTAQPRDPQSHLELPGPDKSRAVAKGACST